MQNIFSAFSFVNAHGLPSVEAAKIGTNIVARQYRYDTYWRLLDLITGGHSSRLEFKQNLYSTYNQRAHFTPVWYPNGTYNVYTWLIDAWTPSGMLSMNLNDSVTIQGSVFDDWRIAPKN